MAATSMRSNRIPRLPPVALCCILASAACGRRDAEPAKAPVVVRTEARTEAHPDAPRHDEGTLHAPFTHGRADLVFSERAGGVAELTSQGERSKVVHNGRPGKEWAAVGDLALSAAGRRCAYAAREGAAWRMVVDEVPGAAFDAVKRPVFSPDGAHLAYQAMRGERWLLVVDGAVRGETRTRYLDHAFGGDSARIVFVDGEDAQDRGRLVVADLALKRPTVVATGVSEFVLNAAKTRVAATAQSGKAQAVLTFALDQPARTGKGKPYDRVKEVAFGEDGVTVVYRAEQAGKQVLVLGDREVPLGDAALTGSLVAVPGRNALAALVVRPAGGVQLRELLGPDAPGEPAYEEAEGLVYSRDGRLHAYAARRGASWVAVLSGKEGPPFDRVVTPVFSPDGRYLAYRTRKAGARFVVVVSTADGAVRLHPAHEQIFPAQFTADGSSIAYGVKDGGQASWIVEAP
jgi:hypothetical protein